MTYGRLAALATALTALGSLVGFLSTGSLFAACGLLAAPLPRLVVFGLLPEHADRTIGDPDTEEDPALAAGLDHALRPPLPDQQPADDGSFFVPGCPPLAPSERTAPPSRGDGLVPLGTRSPGVGQNPSQAGLDNERPDARLLPSAQPFPTRP